MQREPDANAALTEEAGDEGNQSTVPDLGTHNPGLLTGEATQPNDPNGLSPNGSASLIREIQRTFLEPQTLADPDARTILPTQTAGVQAGGFGLMPQFPAQAHPSNQQGMVAPQMLFGPSFPQQNQLDNSRTLPIMSLPQQHPIAPMLPSNTAQFPTIHQLAGTAAAQQGVPQMMLPFLASLQQQYMNSLPAASTSISSAPPSCSVPQPPSFGAFDFSAPVAAAQTDAQSQASSSSNASIFPLHMLSSFYSDSRSSSLSQMQTTSNSTVNDQSIPSPKRRKISANLPEGGGNLPGLNSTFPPSQSSTLSSSQDAVSSTMVPGNRTIPEEDQQIQGTCIPLIMPNDKEWLTKKECFLRTHCFELFSATEGDISSNTSGRRNPVALGQVGIRCVYCSKLPASMRAQRSMCFPSSIRTIQKAFVNLLHLHFPACTEVPENVRATCASLKSSHSPMGSNEYRIESMERILDDMESRKGLRFKDSISAKNLPDAPGAVLFGSDEKFVTDFAFLLFGQMQTCVFSRQDSNLPGSHHEVGYNGLACAHCCKANVMEGRFFPDSPHGTASLYDSGKFYAHTSKCPNVPQDVKDKLLEMKKKDDDQLKKLKAGSKNEFFQRLWVRFHKSFNGKVYTIESGSGSDTACGEW